MKKEWDDPTVRETGVKETKGDVQCIYQPQNVDVSVYGFKRTVDKLTGDICCNCSFNRDCSNSWKYDGACPS